MEILEIEQIEKKIEGKVSNSEEVLKYYKTPEISILGDLKRVTLSGTSGSPDSHGGLDYTP